MDLKSCCKLRFFIVHSKWLPTLLFSVLKAFNNNLMGNGTQYEALFPFASLSSFSYIIYGLLMSLFKHSTKNTRQELFKGIQQEFSHFFVCSVCSHNNKNSERVKKKKLKNIPFRCFCFGITLFNVAKYNTVQSSE